MLARQERTALVLLFGVAVVVIAAHLILTGIGKAPFAHPFAESSPEGELVVVEGTIEQITPTGNGGHLNLKVNNLTVFLPAQVVQDISVRKGDRIQVYGTVQTYRGKREVVVNSAGDLRVILPPS